MFIELKDTGYENKNVLHLPRTIVGMEENAAPWI